MNRLSSLRRRIRRAVLARRRLLAAITAAAAVAAGLQAVAAPAPARQPVLTAARDLPSGTVLQAGDLRWVPFDPGSVPSGVVDSLGEALARTTAGPVRSGEPITDVRLVEPSLLAGYPGMVAAPVRIADAEAVELLRVGDRIDVLAADPQSRAPARVVASGVTVLALPRADPAASNLASGGLVVLALPLRTAQEVAGAGVAAYLSVVITR